MNRWIAMLGAIVALMLLPATHASAHEHRHVSGFDFSVGWVEEPAYAGFLNEVGITVTAEGGQPVTDIPAGALKVEVTTGTDRTTLSLAPAFSVGVFGTPGQYTAPIIPTRAGTYTWHVTGEIHGTKIDATFTSSDTTFDSPADPSAVQFPDKAPSNKELADRVTAESERLKADNTRLIASLRRANDATDDAKLFGYLGTGIGAVAFLLAAAGLARKKAA